MLAKLSFLFLQLLYLVVSIFFCNFALYPKTNDMKQVVRHIFSVLMGIIMLSACSEHTDITSTVNGADYPDRDAERDPKTIILMTDIHVMSPELLKSEGEAFTNYVSTDPKLLEYSGEVLNKIIDETLQRKPDLVIIPGDLTKDGELLSHQLVAKTLGRLRQADIPVVVVPGNHDIENPNGKYFDGAVTQTAERTTPQQFESIYGDFGYNMAIARDEASLSYACEPLDGLVLLCIDSNMYEYNLYKDKGDAYDYNQTAGRIRDATLTWMLEQADKAHEQGKQVAVVQHHNIVQHHDAEGMVQSYYIIKDYEEVGRLMMQHGIHLAFTGHLHLHDIAQYRIGGSTVADSLVDVATGSAVSYPNAWRVMTASNEFTKWKIGTEYVKSTPSVADVQKMSYDRLSDKLYTAFGGYVREYWQTINEYRSKLMQYNLPENIIPATADELSQMLTTNLGAQMCEAFMIHNEGNEGKNPRSAAVMSEMKSNMQKMCSKRFEDIGVDKAKAAIYMTAFNSVYDKYLTPFFGSMLTDTNQMGEGALSSVTDDVSTTLYLPRK